MLAVVSLTCKAAREGRVVKQMATASSLTFIQHWGHKFFSFGLVSLAKLDSIPGCSSSSVYLQPLKERDNGPGGSVRMKLESKLVTGYPLAQILECGGVQSVECGVWSMENQALSTATLQTTREVGC
jgi:hypothetical protein